MLSYRPTLSSRRRRYSATPFNSFVTNSRGRGASTSVKAAASGDLSTALNHHGGLKIILVFTKSVFSNNLSLLADPPLRLTSF